MRSIFVAVAIFFAMATSSSAQLKITTNDSVTGLGPVEWEALVGQIVHFDALNGDPGIAVISSLSVPITLECGGYPLVGTSVDKSVKGNPVTILPYSVTYVKAPSSWDGYCKDGIKGHTSAGRTVIGTLNGVNGSFTTSTVALFSGVK